MKFYFRLKKADSFRNKRFLRNLSEFNSSQIFQIINQRVKIKSKIKKMENNFIIHLKLIKIFKFK